MFDEALRINPAYTEAALNLVVTYNDLGKYEEAKEIYERAMATSKGAPRRSSIRSPREDRQHARRGRRRLPRRAGCTRRPIREYERALALCPTFVDIRTRAGRHAAASWATSTAAMREFERVRAENPQLRRRPRLQLGLRLLRRRAPRRRRAPSGARCWPMDRRTTESAQHVPGVCSIRRAPPGK